MVIYHGIESVKNHPKKQTKVNETTTNPSTYHLSYPFCQSKKWWQIKATNGRFHQVSTPYRPNGTLMYEDIEGLDLKTTWKTAVAATLPKTNVDTQNDGLEKVAPFKHSNFWYMLDYRSVISINLKPLKPAIHLPKIMVLSFVFSGRPFIFPTFWFPFPARVPFIKFAHVFAGCSLCRFNSLAQKSSWNKNSFHGNLRGSKSRQC